MFLSTKATKKFPTFLVCLPEQLKSYEIQQLALKTHCKRKKKRDQGKLEAIKYEILLAYQFTLKIVLQRGKRQERRRRERGSAHLKKK